MRLERMADQVIMDPKAFLEYQDQKEEQVYLVPLELRGNVVWTG